MEWACIFAIEKILIGSVKMCLPCQIDLQIIVFYCDTGAGESRENGGSVKGRAEPTQGLITEAAAQQQNP